MGTILPFAGSSFQYHEIKYRRKDLFSQKNATKAINCLRKDQKSTMLKGERASEGTGPPARKTWVRGETLAQVETGMQKFLYVANHQLGPGWGKSKKDVVCYAPVFSRC